MAALCIARLTLFISFLASAVWAQENPSQIASLDLNPTPSSLFNFNDPTYTQGLSDCYSDDSICTLTLDLDSLCDDALGLPWNYTSWYMCLCEKGWVSAKQACYDCQDTYSMGNDILTMSEWSSECSSRGLTIAPIPSSIMSAWSEHNATFTVTESEVETRSRTLRLPSITQTQGIKTLPPLSGLPTLTGLPTSNFVVTLGGVPTSPLQLPSQSVVGPNAASLHPAAVGRCVAVFAAVLGIHWVWL